MKIKDGGATLSVEQATSIGAQLSQLIIEILLELLFRRNEVNDDERQREYLRVLQEIQETLNTMKEQLEFKSSSQRLIADEQILTPAQRVFADSVVQSSGKEKFLTKAKQNNEDYGFHM